MGLPMSSRRMEPLQQIADLREDEAARALLDAQRLLAEREQRLLELQNYRGEYERAAVLPMPSLLRNRHQFLERLREAERFQRALVEQAQRGVDQQRASWLLQQRECKTIAQLTESYLRRERREDERRDQKQLDELATQRHFRMRSAD